MTFFKRQDIGRVYVVKLILPDSTIVHKVGMTHTDRATDRMMEILRSWFSYFRYVPYAELKLDMQCNNPLEIEAYMHSILRPLSFTPKFKVQGSTEMFTGVNEYKLLTFMKAVNNSNLSKLAKVSDSQAKVLSNLLRSDNGK